MKKEFMWTRIGLTICLLAAGILIASAPLTSKDLNGSIKFKGYKRTFLIHLPPNYDTAHAYPLVVVLHGGGGTARHMKQRFSGFDGFADRNGFIALYPDGVGRQWNDGRKINESEAHRENVDDVGFLSGLVDYVIRRHNANAKRVYFTGISNGAIMSYRLACEIPEKITAIAAVTANLPENLISAIPSTSIPVMIINGTKDPLVPWEGGSIRVPLSKGKDRGKVISTADTVRFWIKANGCAEAPVDEELPDRDPGDDCRVVRHTYGGCARGAEVVLYEMRGGGHTWPGGPQYLPVSVVGKTCKDIDATVIIGEFFIKHEKK